MAKRLALLGLVGFYLVVALGQGWLKLIWVDELITYYVSQQAGIKGVWRALEAGADPNPPLMHVLVRASTAALGANVLNMRVPSILCVLLATVVLWWMLNRWVETTYAAAGVLAFMATRGFDYAYDARSYGLLMGFCMASVGSWMYVSSANGWRRCLGLAGMTVMLAAGVSSNYYGVLAWFPIAVGELVAKRFRVGVWGGMAVASLPLLAYLPLIRHNIAEFGPHAWNQPRLSMVGWSYLELVEGVFWPVLGLGMWAAWKRVGLGRMAREEAAAVGVLLAYPVLGYAIAVSGAGMISPRCVAPVCCGFGLAAGVLGERVFGRYRRAGVAMVAVLALWVTVREGFCASVLLEQRRAFFALRDRVAAEGAGQILVADSSFVLPLYFYSGEEVRRRIVVPIDFEAIHRYETDDSGEENLWAGRGGVWPFRVVRFADVDLGHGRTIVVGRPGGWLAMAVRGEGVRLVESGAEEVYGSVDWYRMGGVFTPMAHEETRILTTK